MRRILTILAALAMATAVYAQGTAFEWIRISRNPAAAGMSGAGYASLSHGAAYSVTGNPAAAPLADGRLSAAGSLSVVPSGEKSRSVTAAGLSWNTGKMSISAAYTGGKYPEVAFASDGGASAGSYAPSDLMAGLGLGFAIGDKLSFGANVRFAKSSLSAKKDISTVNGDIAALWKSGALGISAGVYAIGPEVTSGNSQYGLPTSAKLSGDYTLDLGESTLDLCADADYFFNGTVGLAAGSCFTWREMVSVRAGYCYGTPAKTSFKAAPVPTHFAIGVGGKLAGAGLDLALCILPGAGTTFSAGISYGF